jgi:hypothetical protein
MTGRALVRGAAKRLCALAAIASTAALAQSPRTIKIIDQTSGAPIALAEVKVTASGRSADLTSDDDGVIQLAPSLWQGAETLHLSISAVGYASLEADVAQSTAADQLFRLRAAKIDDGEIVIQARRISRPFSPVILGFQDIVTDAKAQADPILAVNDLPSSTNVTGNARLSLRGSRAAINRAYLNDTPVYEFATGSELDNSTQGRSVFGLAVANEVETYPANPPAYLAGATGGVVRLTTPDNKIASGVYSINDFGVGAGRTFASSDGADFLSLYGSLTDLSLHRAINPTLDEVFKRIRGVSGGGLGRKAFADGGELGVFVQGEVGDDVFPFRVFGNESLFHMQPAKGRVLVNGSIPWAGTVVSANVAYTYASVPESFGSWRSDNINQYGFGSLDLTRRFADGRIVARVGIDSESIDQKSRTNSGAAGSVYSPTSGFQTVKHDLRQTTGYLFATWQPGKALTLSLGSRYTIASSLKSGASIQVSGTLVSPNERHKLIISAGRYSGFAVPTRAYYGPISRSVSRQAEIDYLYRWRHGRIGVTGYLSEERSDGQFYDPVAFGNANITDNITGIARLTKSQGVEAYTEVALAKAFGAKLSYTTVHQTLTLGGQRLRGANDFPHIIRASLRYTAPPATSLSLALTRRSGEPFTRADTSNLVNGTFTPVYGTINGIRFPPYFSIDASFSRQIAIGATLGKPLFFVSLNNLLDHHNPSSQILTLPNAGVQYRYLSGRTASFGLIWTY